MAVDLAAYADVLFGPRTRLDIERRQGRLWRGLRRQFNHCPALKPYASADLADIPVTDIADFRRRFDDFSTRGLTLADAEGGRLPPGLEAGFSTGTSGGRPGLFVTSPRERAVYTGRILARLLKPWQLIGLTRIAVCLRASSRLYESQGVRFFGLADPGRDAAIAAFDPQALIAPPQVLLALASAQHRFKSLRHLYYGAETLNDAERAFVTERLGRRPDPIYQATEGFLGAPCHLGTLHLNEDGLIFGREDLGGGRFRPIVTDLLRRTQLVVRLRLDDILLPTICLCGSPLQAIHPVEGRASDVWRWTDRSVFPGDVEKIVTSQELAGHSWFATGHPGGIRFACASDTDAPAIAQALSTFGRPVTRQPYDPALDFPKRRHVRWGAA